MQDAPETTDTKTDWAERRTDWAEDRTTLANERTYAGWLRTGLTAVAVAIGLHVVFGSFEPAWVPKAVATLFLGIAIAIFWAARQAACHTLGRLERQSVETLGTRRITAIAAALSLATAATGAVLWAL